jgi:hypothetical protein
MSKRSYHTFRQPSTTPTLREVAFAKVDEYRIHFRGKRRNVPTVYEDICRSWHKSWKAYRKTQFK